MYEFGRWLISAGLIIMLCLSCYLLGRSHAEIKTISRQGEELIKQTEVIKYVEKKKSKIWSVPHAGRNELLKLMRESAL